MTTPINKLITNLEKSKSDTLDYAVKILSNGLKILFISDPEANKSAAALGVNIGNLSDPQDIPGLAHFCEHLLSMGTKKYPLENEYSSFLSKNSGVNNAYTVADRTIYYFEVANEAFEGTLDRFAQFFISPLFNEGSVEREINAIDSEFSKNINNDSWRFTQLKISQMKKESVFNKFSTGNKETLSLPDIRDRLITFYKKYYSSEVMNLCVYSKKPMNELVKFVEDLFILVPKIENFQKPKYDEIMPYDETNLKQFYKIVPLKNADEIGFNWFLPFCDNYYANPLGYLISVFGHEGPNSLTASLYKDNLCNTLVSSSSNQCNTYMVFSITISLTKKGVENYKEVILRTLKYIKIIQSKKINEKYFYDLKNIYQLRFDYKNKLSPINATKGYASLLMNYKPEDILFAGKIFKEYDENLIRKYLNLLTLDNLNIYFISNSFEKECELTEKWFGTKYHKEKLNITEEEINSYTCEHILDYIPENKFIPKNFEIFPSSEKIGKYPEKIIGSKNCEVWFLQDIIFKKPKAYLVAQFVFPNDICNFSEIKNRIVSILLEKIITQELGEWIYMAKEANVNFGLSITNNKCQIIYCGFNDSLKEGMKEILNIFKNLNINNKRCIETLELQLKELLKQAKNIYYAQNYEVNLEYIKCLLNEPAKHPEDIINFLSENTVSIDDLILFKNEMFKKSKIKWLFQGNITKEIAMDIFNETNKILEIDINKEKKGRFIISRPVQFKKNYNFIFRTKSPNKNENNSSLISIYQLGLLKDKEILYLKIVHSFLQEKFYNKLRTKETLGYIVSLLMSQSSNAYCLLGVVQSNTKIPEFCAERVRNFIKESFELIKNISDDVFKYHVNSILVLESKKDDNLNEAFLRNWEEIHEDRYIFDRKEKNCEILKNSTKEDLIKFYEKYFINEVSILDSEFLCPQHYEENNKKMKEAKILENEKIIKRVICDDIDDFKACNTLFPIYNNALFMSINK